MTREPAFFMVKNRQYNSLSTVQVVHHELNEIIDPAFIKELHKMVAYKLFNQWLEERRRKEVISREENKAA